MKKKKNKLMIIFLVFMIAVAVVFWTYRNIFFPKKYSDIVEQAASIYNVDPNLIYAVIKQESKFNKDALSSSNAKGLMQIMDSTAKDMVKNIDSIDSKNYNLFDPYTNIFIGTKYLSYLIKYFNGNYYLAITAYNAGLGKVDDWIVKDYNHYNEYNKLLEIIKYNETRIYVTNIINYYNYYTKLY